MKVYHFTQVNSDAWALANDEIVVVAENKQKAKQLLEESGYQVEKTSELVELGLGVHRIQERITE